MDVGYVGGKNIDFPILFIHGLPQPMVGVCNIRLETQLDPIAQNSSLSMLARSFVKLWPGDITGLRRNKTPNTFLGPVSTFRPRLSRGSIISSPSKKELAKTKGIEER